MNLTFLKPRAALTAYVRAIWVCQSGQGLPVAEPSIAAPNGCPKLVLLFENSLTSVDAGVKRTNQEGLYFVGNRDTSVTLQTSSRPTRFAVIEFFPHGAFPIFGVPMRDIAQGQWGVSQIISQWQLELEARAPEASIEAQLGFIEEKAVQQLRHSQVDSRIVAYCVQELSRTHGRMLIRDLEQSTGYSRRYLELLFKTHIGLTPKALAGILRFQKFHRRWAEGQALDAIKADLYDEYYDQSHFSREFKRMTGHSPGRYVNLPNEYGRRIALR